MNATWMLNLYPCDWRARYGDEFGAMLDEHEASVSDLLDIAFGALDAHLRPDQSGLAGRGNRPPAFWRASAFWQRLLFAHAGLYLLGSIVLLLINLATTPAHPWFLYPVWGWGLALAVQAGLTFRWKGLFGAHLVTFLVLNAGLIAIDLTHGAAGWSVWPLLTLGILLLGHWLAAFRTGLLPAHVMVTALASLELVIVGAVAGDAGIPLRAIPFVLLLLGAHALLRYRRASLYPVHVVAFVVGSALLALENLAEGSPWWFIYPVVAWSIPVAAHTIVHRRLVQFPGDSEAGKVMASIRGQVTAVEAQSVQTRGLVIHAFLFGVGVIDLMVLNLLTTPHLPWMLWPAGAWAVLLAAHAGFVFLPRHRLLGADLAGGLAGALALVIIDAATPSGPWAVWPIMGWLLVLTLHATLALTPRFRLLAAHFTTGLVLSVELVIVDLITPGGPWFFWPVLGLNLLLVLHLALATMLNTRVRTWLQASGRA